MKKLFSSLPFRLLVGVVLGIVIGIALNSAETAGVATGLVSGALNVIVSVKYILGQVITFCVPLIVIGFIAPSITELGNNASKMDCRKLCSMQPMRTCLPSCSNQTLSCSN